MTPLSWQPPPVTKCEECPFGDDAHWLTCDYLVPSDQTRDRALFEQNKDGITPTCPAWQQQNKEKL